MSRARRRQMVDREHPKLSVVRRALCSVSAGHRYTPVPVKQTSMSLS